ATEAALLARLAATPGNAQDWAQDWAQLGLLRGQSGRPAAAAEAFARAVAAGAALPGLAMPYAVALADAGRPEEAVAIAAAAVARRPRDCALLNLQGVMLKRASRYAEAVTVLKQALRLEPRRANAWQNLGNVQMLLAEHTGAAAAFAAALKLEPRNAELWRLHGRALRAAHDLPGALASLEKSCALDPKLVEAATELAGIHLALGAPDRAGAAIARARAQQPADNGLRIAEARLMLATGRLAETQRLIEEVLAAAPGHPGASILFARLMGEKDRAATNAVLRRGLAAHPNSTPLAGELIESLGRSRHGDEAAHLQAAYELACSLLQRDPDGARNHARPIRTAFQRCLDLGRLAQTGTMAELAPRWVAEGAVTALHSELGQVETLEDRIRILDWHKDWGRRVQAGITPLPPAAEALAIPALQTGRPIRLGFMSSDLRNHPVAYFAEPLLTRYDRSRFEVFCYSFYEREEDEVQAAIAASVQGFRWWPRRSTPEVAEGIARDGLDMLFELGGTTAMNKLGVMAYRPARIGASWLGYPHSAGLEAIDYILVDPYIRPSDPRLLQERPFEMPETWVTMGSAGFRPVPIEDRLPEERRGTLTFGTMNNPYKFTAACIDAWAAVLRAVPGSRFLFVRPEGRAPAFVANARALFAARDVDPDRLEFIGIRGQHLPHYNAIDIALDSLPHVGGTTTCECLWMGVPVVSLVGPGFPERLSYSNLSNAGLGDLAVFSVADYVATAAALAADRPRRRLLRQGLRGMIREHPLGQEERFIGAFYDRVAQVVRA
ncbi:MAG: tetratricopeptide repeat protein, partial [Acetobacteraceae bacterium]